MTEEQIKNELIEYCKRRIAETGLICGYYYDIIKVLESPTSHALNKF